MQLSSGTHIPDGLLAANALLSEKLHQGSRTSAHTLHQGFRVAISSTSLGIKASLYDGDVGSRCTGKERDAESGLDYFGARYYGSSMGRFISPDWASNPVTIPFANIYDPQSLNLYSYTGNNPLSRFDPDGHLDCASNTQDVACAVTAAAKAVWHWLSSGSGDSGGNQGGSVTTSQTASVGGDTFTYNNNSNQPSLVPRNVSLNFGGSAEAGLGAGYAGMAQGSAVWDFKSNHVYGLKTYGGTAGNGVWPNAHQSPDPKDWVWSTYAGGGFSLSVSNGTESQMSGPAHSVNLGGRFLPYGIGVSYSYTGSFWKPGVYQLTVSPPFVNWGAGAYFSHYNTNTSVVDENPED